MTLYHRLLMATTLHLFGIRRMGARQWVCKCPPYREYLPALEILHRRRSADRCLKNTPMLLSPSSGVPRNTGHHTLRLKAMHGPLSKGLLFVESAARDLPAHHAHSRTVCVHERTQRSEDPSSMFRSLNMVFHHFPLAIFVRSADVYMLLLDSMTIQLSCNSRSIETSKHKSTTTRQGSCHSAYGTWLCEVSTPRRQ